VTVKSLTFAVVVLVLTGVYLNLMEVLAPKILERDRDASVWRLHDLADEKIREWRDLKWIAPHEERQRLIDEAAEHLNRIRVLRPDSEFYEYYWAVTQYQSAMFRENRDPDEVLSSVERLIRLWEEGDRESIRLGNILADHYIQGIPDNEKAKEILARLIELDPKTGKRYDDLVEILMAQGERVEAIRLLEKKIELNLANAGNRETLASLYFDLNDWDRVEEILKSNLAGGATTRMSWLMYGVTCAVQGEFRSGFEALESYWRGVPVEVPFPSSPSPAHAGYPKPAFPAFSYLMLESSLFEEKVEP